MVEWARWFLSGLPLIVLTAIGTHLVVSSSQTLFHYGLGHHRMGGIFYRNHIRFHHTHYAKGYLVSSTRRRNAGNNTPYFLIPTILVAGAVFLLFPFNLFVVMAVASAASFGAHVYLDKQYYAEESILARFAWFRRKQQLHFVHHLHGEQQFRGDRFFLGQGSRDLPKSGHGPSLKLGHRGAASDARPQRKNGGRCGGFADGFASGDRARDASKSALISRASEPPLPLLCSSH